MLFLLIVFFMLLVLYLVIAHRRHLEKYSAFYKVPTPPYHVPLLGNTLLLNKKNDVLGIMTEMFKYGNEEKRSNPEEAKIVLNQALDKSLVYQFLTIVFENTLLMAPIALWRRNRKIAAKGFRQNVLNTFVPIFNGKSRVLLDKLRNEDFQDLCKLFETYTLDIFFEATVGVESHMMTTNNFEIVNIVTTVQEILFGRIGRIMAYFDFIFQWTEEWSIAEQSSNTILAFIRKIIAQKRQSTSQESGTVQDGLEPMPVLDILLKEQPKEKFTDEYITKEVLLFAGAATDTTAYSLVYIFLMLAMHPDVQDKVLEEVLNVLGDHQEICAQDLHQLKYTEMAINEAMRILPSIPIIGRTTHQDLNIGTCIIPPKTDIAIHILEMHRDETIYPDPLKYDPERFRPDEVAKRHPYSFLPFSGGPRNCIGFKYAKMILLVTVASVVRSFCIETSHKSVGELELASAIVMAPKKALDIRFVERPQFKKNN